MTPRSHFFHRRSLTLAVLAFAVSVLAVGHAFGFSLRSRPPSAFFALRFVVLCVLTFAVCIHATVHLIRDVKRGYAPWRCSIAAVILLVAFVLSTWAGIGLASLLIN